MSADEIEVEMSLNPEPLEGPIIVGDSCPTCGTWLGPTEGPGVLSLQCPCGNVLVSSSLDLPDSP